MFSAVRRQFRFWHGDLRLVQIHTPVACVGFSCQCFATTSPTWRFCLGFDFAATHQWCAGACSWHPRLSLEWVRWPSITANQRTSSIDYTPGVQLDSSNPSGLGTPRHLAPETIEIPVFSNPSTNHECTDKPIGALEDGDRCDVDAIKIVYALDCGNEAQNAAITELLAATAQSGTISTIVDDDCGVLFWTGSLADIFINVRCVMVRWMDGWTSIELALLMLPRLPRLL